MGSSPSQGIQPIFSEEYVERDKRCPYAITSSFYYTEFFHSPLSLERYNISRPLCSSSDINDIAPSPSLRLPSPPLPFPGPPLTSQVVILCSNYSNALLNAASHLHKLFFEFCRRHNTSCRLGQKGISQLPHLPARNDRAGRQTSRSANTPNKTSICPLTTQE